MTTKLIPLKNIPSAARSKESEARKRYPNRSSALLDASWCVVAAPGTHGRPYFDPPVIGWVVTAEAATAMAKVLMADVPGTPPYRLFDSYQSSS